jgi:hypothetical protein
VFVGTDPENAAKVWRALAVFGAPLSGLQVEDLTQPDTFFIMGRPPNQIDIITSIDGVSFETAWPNRIESTFGDVRVNYISKEDLLANKAAAGRPQDKLDLEYLRGRDNC